MKYFFYWFIFDSWKVIWARIRVLIWYQTENKRQTLCHEQQLIYENTYCAYDFHGICQIILQKFGIQRSLFFVDIQPNPSEKRNISSNSIH